MCYPVLLGIHGWQNGLVPGLQGRVLASTLMMQQVGAPLWQEKNTRVIPVQAAYRPKIPDSGLTLLDGVVPLHATPQQRR